MKRSTVRDTLRHVQRIITEETGAALQGQARKRLQEVLNDAIASTSKSRPPEKFSSREVTMLLADLRGFTSISEAYPAGVVLGLLNRYLTAMSEVVIRHQGSINKFLGDSIMVLFGAPDARKDDVRRAVACAVDMQIAMGEVNRHHKQAGMPELFMGIGINTGTVMAGLVGSDLYSEYTVIGDEMNLASRIEAFSLRGQVLISKGTHDRCRDFVKTGEPIDVFVKGKANPVTLHEVLGIPSLGTEVPRVENRKSPRVKVKMPFVYHAVENKIVMPQSHNGTVLDLGYHGALTELGQELAPYSEIKLDLELSLVGHSATDVYAKILRTRQDGNCYRSNIEFTVVSDLSGASIKRFVQLLVQGSETK